MVNEKNKYFDSLLIKPFIKKIYRKIHDEFAKVPTIKGDKDGTPVGTIISLMGYNPPDGYLVCDGAEYLISDYPQLSSFFAREFEGKSNGDGYTGINFFGGDGILTFKVPDLRNDFLRGYHSDTESLSGEIGMKQDATLIPSITSNSAGNKINAQRNSNYHHNVTNYDTVITRNMYTYIQTSGLNNVEDGIPALYTSRPVNMAILMCIKY